LFNISISTLFIIKAVHYAPSHLLSGWITAFNHHSKLLTQSTLQNVKSILLLAKHAYDARDKNANQKIQFYLGIFDDATLTVARPLVYNPLTINSLLRLLTVPCWSDFLMNNEMLAWLHKARFSDLVSICMLYLQTHW